MPHSERSIPSPSQERTFLKHYLPAILVLALAIPAAPKATTRFRSTVLTPSRPAPPWSSSTPTSPPTANATSSTECIPPTTPSTKPSKSRRASTSGLRSGSTSSPASAADRASSGSATTSAPASACQIPGTGLSASALSTEFGYQRARFAPDTWNWEIRPIVDKQSGRWYWAINPALERAWHGPDVDLGVDFAPNVKVSYDFTKQITGGIEYYADYGSITHIASFHDQQQQIFPAIDLNVSPDWEFNFGVGIGPTAATDHWIVKCIVGRRFSWKPKR